jgi:hypothetical protein
MTGHLFKLQRLSAEIESVSGVFIKEYFSRAVKVFVRPVFGKSEAASR